MDRPANDSSASCPNRYRFQFSLTQLLLVVLSIGGCATAWAEGWVSLVLPIVWAWAWWFAFRRNWLLRVGLCFLLPAFMLWLGFDYVLFTRGQSQFQRALPLDWAGIQITAIREQRHAEAVRNMEAEVITQPSDLGPLCAWDWGLLLPLALAGVGYLFVRRTRLGKSDLGWAAVGATSGLLVVLMLVAYPSIRASIRKAALRAHWQSAEVLYYEGQYEANERSVRICVADKRSSECSGDRLLLLRKQALWQRWFSSKPADMGEREAEYLENHPKVDVSREDAEELWELLGEAGVFSLNSELFPYSIADGCDSILRIQAGPHTLRISSWMWMPEDIPMFRAKQRLLKWLKGKGFPEPCDVLHGEYSEAEYLCDLSESDSIDQ